MRKNSALLLLRRIAASIPHYVPRYLHPRSRTKCISHTKTVSSSKISKALKRNFIRLYSSFLMDLGDWCLENKQRRRERLFMMRIWLRLWRILWVGMSLAFDDLIDYSWVSHKNGELKLTGIRSAFNFLLKIHIKLKLLDKFILIFIKLLILYLHSILFYYSFSRLMKSKW